jgi:tRNA pseudouridine38-40 synthase
MNKALSYLSGEHDFTSFRGADCEVPNNICFIYNISCKKVDDRIILDIEGNRFLTNMVRIIVGTLLLIEKDSLPPETMKEVLESKDRTKAGQTVNPYGLTLMKVEY